MDREIHWHARAVVLEILGSTVFIDTSGDGVPAMYLQFMQNAGQPKSIVGEQLFLLCYIDS